MWAGLISPEIWLGKVFFQTCVVVGRTQFPMGHQTRGLISLPAHEGGASLMPRGFTEANRESKDAYSLADWHEVPAHPLCPAVWVGSRLEGIPAAGEEQEAGCTGDHTRVWLQQSSFLWVHTLEHKALHRAGWSPRGSC